VSAVPEPSANVYADLCALPEHLTGEILNRRPAYPAAAGGAACGATSGLLMEVGGPFQQGRGGPGGWRIHHKPEVHFIRDTGVCVPDIAGWRRARMPTIPRGHRFEIVPDWVCEILSPDTARKDRVVKMPLYARHGVAYPGCSIRWRGRWRPMTCWRGQWRVIGLFQCDDVVQVAPFEALELPLANLWADLDETPGT
jgi:hypothetical protein